MNGKVLVNVWLKLKRNFKEMSYENYYHQSQGIYVSDPSIACYVPNFIDKTIIPTNCPMDNIDELRIKYFKSRSDIDLEAYKIAFDELKVKERIDRMKSAFTEEPSKDSAIVVGIEKYSHSYNASIGLAGTEFNLQLSNYIVPNSYYTLNVDGGWRSRRYHLFVGYVSDKNVATARIHNSMSSYIESELIAGSKIKKSECYDVESYVFDDSLPSGSKWVESGNYVDELIPFEEETPLTHWQEFKEGMKGPVYYIVMELNKIFQR